MNARNIKEQKVQGKKKTSTASASKGTERKKPRKRKPSVPKKQTLRQRAAKPGPLRTTLLLSGGVLIVCLYAWFIEADIASVFSNIQGFVIVFFGFIGFHFLLIYIGYLLGKRSTRRKKTRK